MSSPDSNRRIAQRYAETVVTGGDVAAMDDIYAHDAVVHSPLGTTRGLAAEKENMAAFFDAFADLRATVEETVATGDVVAMRTTVRGRHEGEFLGVEATGTAVEYEGSVFVRIEDGLIVEQWLQPDLLGLLSQIGAVDVPGL
ncbi:MAG: ester cyclase [Halobacteriaceae archaeon]